MRARFAFAEVLLFSCVNWIRAFSLSDLRPGQPSLLPLPVVAALSFNSFDSCHTYLPGQLIWFGQTLAGVVNPCRLLTKSSTFILCATTMAASTTFPPAASPERQQNSSVGSGSVRRAVSHGCFAACGATLVSHPMDVIKARMATSSAASSAGIVATFQRLLQDEGPRAFARGLGPATAASVAMNGIRLGLDEQRRSTRHYDTPSWISPSFVRGSSDGSGVTSSMAASVAAGAVGAWAVAPLLAVKTRMQLATAASTSSPLRAALVAIGREGGPRAFWAGCAPMVARVAVGSCAQLVTYDAVVDGLSGIVGRPAAALLGAATASVAVGVAMTPFEVVATQCQATGSSARVLVRRAVRSGRGFASLTQGWTAVVARSGPQTAATLLLLEAARRCFPA